MQAKRKFCEARRHFADALFYSNMTEMLQPSGNYLDNPRL
jgi:hypothetical protein